MPFAPQIGFSELLLIGIIVLVVLGPKDLPKFAKFMGQIFGRVQSMTQDFQQAFSNMIYHDEIETLRKDVEKISLESIEEDSIGSKRKEGLKNSKKKE